MKTIWKYPLGFPETQIKLPAFSKPVHLGLDPNRVTCLWCLVDTDFADETMIVSIRGTGQPAPLATYFGSYVDGSFMWHVFYSFRKQMDPEAEADIRDDCRTEVTP